MRSIGSDLAQNLDRVTNSASYVDLDRSRGRFMQILTDFLGFET